MDAWQTMLRDLGRALSRREDMTLVQWLTTASPGQSLLVACETPRQKGNVQSRVNRIAITRRISCAATRLEDGVLVERL